MRKQIITIVACLALTSTSAFAKCGCPKTASPVAPAPMAVAQPAPDEAAPCPNESMKKKFEAKMEKDRQELYTKLGLTKVQKAKADALHKSTKADLEPLFAKFHEEKVKLHELKEQKACPDKIDAQKANVKTAKVAIKKYMEKSKQDFDAILTDCQKAKLKTLMKAKKAEMEAKCPCKGKCHCHHHLAPFSPEPEQAPAEAPAPAKTCPVKK